MLLSAILVSVDNTILDKFLNNTVRKCFMNFDDCCQRSRRTSLKWRIRTWWCWTDTTITLWCTTPCTPSPMTTTWPPSSLWTARWTLLGWDNASILPIWTGSRYGNYTTVVGLPYLWTFYSAVQSRQFIKYCTVAPINITALYNPSTHYYSQSASVHTAVVGINKITKYRYPNISTRVKQFKYWTLSREINTEIIIEVRAGVHAEWACSAPLVIPATKFAVNPSRTVMFSVRDTITAI